MHPSRTVPCRTALLLATCLALLMPAVARGEKPKKETKEAPKRPQYIRVLYDDHERPTELQTAIVRFTPTDEERAGLHVDLIGAIHVADPAYYEQLNKRFRKYEALLYELVAPEGAAVPKGGGPRDNPVSMLQGGMTSMLDLQFQLEGIDYSRRNFVHADMTPDEFAQSMRDNDESFLKLMMRMMGQAMAQQSKKPTKSSDLEMLSALFAKDRPVRLKRIMAGQFAESEGVFEALEGEKGSTLVTGRNRKALQVLQEQIAAGKNRIGIFYGAGHMADMERRLIDEFKLKRGRVKWITAWTIE